MTLETVKFGLEIAGAFIGLLVVVFFAYVKLLGPNDKE